MTDRLEATGAGAGGEQAVEAAQAEGTTRPTAVGAERPSDGGGAARIVLWRHGQTDDNVALRLQGQVDNPLNAAGREQAARGAAALAERLRATGGEVRLVSSDLVRAHDTARRLGDELGLDVELDEGLRERSFGPWEGMTHAEITASWPEAFTRWRAGRDPEVDGIEGRGACARRVGGALERLAADTTPGATLVATAHGAAISLAVTHLLGLDPETWAGVRGIDNCHWAVLRPNPGRTPHWSLTVYNAGA